MGAVTGLLGVGGGAGGTSFAAPGQANLVDPVNPGQLNNAAINTNNTMAAQQGLLSALQGQNGIQNQSDSYNQMQGIANGTGPNPAQAQYNQNIQNLAAQQAGAIASTKGISPALQARMISEQGSAAMQNAAGQGAANLANQQLGALNSAANIAGQQASNQIGQVNANAQSAQANQGNLLNAASNFNNSLVSGQNSVNSANASMANTQMGGQQKGIGGLFNPSGLMGAAEGGEVIPIPSDTPIQASPKEDSDSGGSGQLMQMAPLLMAAANGGAVPQSKFAQFLNSSKNKQVAMAQGGQVPALVSPGEHWLPPKAVQEVAKGKNPLSVGEDIPGKPKVKGNSYTNDVVPKNLDVGGIVIPNSIMQSKNPAKGASDFVAKIMAKRGSKK